MIKIKNDNEIELMRQGGKILASVLFEVAKIARPGVSTAELDEAAENLLFQKGARPAFKGFNGYPASLCASINEQIVHALPSDRKLKEGDIVGLDLGAFFPSERCGVCLMASGCSSPQIFKKNLGEQGMHTDMAITVPVGKVSAEAEKLIKAAEGALKAAIEVIKPGRKLSDVSRAIQKYVEIAGFSVIRDLVGHGIGYELHEEPVVPNFYSYDFKDIILTEGMTLALEPMISAGRHQIKKSRDGHGYETKDKSLTAHFEHTVAVTKNGCEVLTKL